MNWQDKGVRRQSEESQPESLGLNLSETIKLLKLFIILKCWDSRLPCHENSWRKRQENTSLTDWHERHFRC